MYKDTRVRTQPAQRSTPCPTRCVAGSATCIPASFGSGNTSATGASNFAAAYTRSTKVHNVNGTVRGAPAGTFTAYCFTIIQHVTCVADKKNPCCRPGDEKLLLKKVGVGTGRSQAQLALQLPCSAQCLHTRALLATQVCSCRMALPAGARAVWCWMPLGDITNDVLMATYAPTNVEFRGLLPCQQRPHQVGIRNGQWTVRVPDHGQGLWAYWGAVERVCEDTSQ